MRRALALVTLGLLAACLPFPALLTPTSSPSPTETPIATPTIVWFPPRPTFTPLPTIEPAPTENLLPGLGAILLVDGFGTGSPWLLSASNAGSISLEGSRLTIAIIQPQAYLASTRAEPTLVDFYVEVTASPSLCRGTDQYGLLFRATEGGDFYRFAVSCLGEVRFDRVVGGNLAVLMPFTPGAGIPAGAPSSSRLGAWALGSKMRLFVNGYYQFTVNDPLLTKGLLGVFARAAGQTAVTVSFSDLIVRQVSR